MTQIVVNSQAEWDALNNRIENDVEVRATVRVKLTGICEVYGRVVLERGAESSLSANLYLRLWGNARAVLWENASAVLGGNASAVLWENSSAELRGNAVVRCFSQHAFAVLYGFSIAIVDVKNKAKIIRKSKDSYIQRTKIIRNWFERETVEKVNGTAIIYKRVSKEFKTQEKTPRETLWAIGSTLTHTKPDLKGEECGAGKFHGVSHPYFGDDFRSEKDDRYIAIRVRIRDTHAWPNPQYPHKIGFSKGTVLYECNHMGKQITQESKL